MLYDISHLRFSGLQMETRLTVYSILLITLPSIVNYTYLSLNTIYLNIMYLHKCKNICNEECLLLTILLMVVLSNNNK